MLTLIALISISQPIPDHVMESVATPPSPTVQSESVKAPEDDNFETCRKLLHNNCKVGMVDDE